MRKFILSSFALLSFIIANAQPLKIAVQKGQKYKVETSSQMTSSMSMGGETFETSSESTSTIIYDVINFNKNEIELESTCTHISSYSKIMDEERSYDSDKKEGNDPGISKVLSKRLDMLRKIIVDHSGKIIKEEKLEKAEDPAFDMAWMFSGQALVTELFMPEFIGKEFKEGYSFPLATFSRKEKPSTSFSLNKETFSMADTGTYKIDSIRNGIASISYTGIQVMTIQMKMGDELVTNVSKSIQRSDLRVEMNTGIVTSKSTTEESVMKTGTDDSNAQTGKDTVTIRITLLK